MLLSRMLSTALFIFSTILLSSCTVITGKGPVVERELKLDAFTGVQLDGSFNVSIEQGAQQKVLVLGNENILDKLKTDVLDGTLYISLEPGNYINYELEVRLTVTTIEHVVLNGSGDINLGTFVNIDHLNVELDGSGDIRSKGVLGILNKAELDMDGSGDIDLTLKASEVSARLQGSGDIELIGTTPKFSAFLDGSGDIKAFELESINCEVKLQGSGDIAVFASNKLVASLDGSGNIKYRGQPSVEANIDGSGSIDAD